MQLNYISLQCFISILFFCAIITDLNSQCTPSQLGQNIRFASTFDEQVGYSNSISSDGNSVIVGAVNGKIGNNRPGRVRIYSLNGNNWDQKGQELTGINDQDRFGAAVSINEDGNYIIIGAPQTSGNFLDTGGSATIYKFSNNTWTQHGQSLSGLSAGDSFGISVDISGDGQTAIIGASGNDTGGQNAGMATVYKFNNTSMMWESDTTFFGDVLNYIGTGADVSISNDGNTIGVASNLNSRVFHYNSFNDTWEQRGADFKDDNSQFYMSRMSLSYNGNRVGIGNENYNSFEGEILVYEYDTSTLGWEVIGDTIKGGPEFRPVGASFSLDNTGDNLVAGCIFYRNQPFADRQKGSTLVYTLDDSSSSWIQSIEPILGVNRDDRFGFSVDISGDGRRIIAGAPFNNNDVTIATAGESRVFEIDTSNCGGCSFSTDTTFVDITIPCNAKLEPPKIMDQCLDSLICGIPLDSGFYFMQDTFMTQWKFTTSDGTMDTVDQKIIVDGIVVCDTISTGIGSLRNALACAEEGDTVNVFENLTNDTLILEAEGLMISHDVIIQVGTGQNITIDASQVPTAFLISPGSTLTIDGVQLITGSAMEGGVAVNNGKLNIVNSTVLPNPTSSGGSQFSGNGEINIDPVTTIHPPQGN